MFYEVIIMLKNMQFYVELDHGSYHFYNEIAKHLERPIEEILSDTLCVCVEFIARTVSREEQ